MKIATITALKAICECDPARSQDDRENLLRALGLNAKGSDTKQPSAKLVSFEEAAERLNRTTATIHTLARRGVLQKVILPGFRRASGVLEADLDKLLKSSTREQQVAG